MSPGLALTYLLAHFIDHGAEVVDVFEASVDARKADVGHLVELLELSHHQLADAAGDHFTLPKVQQFFFDALDGAVDLVGAHGPLAQCQVERAQQLAAVVFNAPAVLLHDGREVHFRPLVGGEALVARAALAAAADEDPILRHPRFNDLRLEVAAEGTLHGFRLWI